MNLIKKSAEIFAVLHDIRPKKISDLTSESLIIYQRWMVTWILIYLVIPSHLMSHRSANQCLVISAINICIIGSHDVAELAR